MENYVIINGKKLRKGYTTGSCAAAASKAAVLMLLSGKPIASVDITTPAGIRLKLTIHDVQITENGVNCAVIKDGGDDPDITSGLKIYSTARFKDTSEIEIKAGEGIGTVTLPGLRVEVGQPAINPVPRSMILKEVSEVLPDDTGVELLLSIPGGEEVAMRTYNPKLGIVGGLSILGTTGIVEPMSEDAWKDSLALELSMAAAKGLKTIVFIFGNYGEYFVINKLGIDGSLIVTVSNFVGFMLDKAVENKFEKILFVGHLGKLVKVAAGIFHTHSRIADARMEIMTAYAALENAPKEALVEMYECRTTEAAAKVIEKYGLHKVYDRIAANVSRRCREYTYNKIEFGAILFNSENELLALDTTAQKILKMLGSKYE